MKVNVCFQCMLFGIVRYCKVGQEGLQACRVPAYWSIAQTLINWAWMHESNSDFTALISHWTNWKAHFFSPSPPSAFCLRMSGSAWSPADWLISRSIENMKGQIEHQTTRCCPVVPAGWNSQRTAVARQRLLCWERRDKGWSREGVATEVCKLSKTYYLIP